MRSLAGAAAAAVLLLCTASIGRPAAASPADSPPHGEPPSSGAWRRVGSGAFPQTNLWTAADPGGFRLFALSLTGAIDEDTLWVFDPRTDLAWQRFRTVGHEPRPAGGGAGLFFDQRRGRIVAFTPQGQGSLGTGRLWTLDVFGDRAWTSLSTRDGPHPSIQDHVMALDAARDRLVLFGGRLPGDRPNSDDVWVLPLDGSTGWRWRRIQPGGTVPQVRYGASFAVTPDGSRIVVLGGRLLDLPGARYTDAVWELALDRERPTWRSVPVEGRRPRPRNQATLVSTARDRFLFIGGTTQSGDDAAAWRLEVGETARWDSLAVPGAVRPPAGRPYPVVSVAPDGDALLLHSTVAPYRSGIAGVWRLDTGDNPRWRLLTVTPDVVTPGKRRNFSLELDPIRRRLVLYGGSNQGGRLGDLWTWNLDDDSGWRFVPTNSENVPGPRSGHTMVYDARRDRMVLFGGYVDYRDTGYGVHVYANDLWELALDEPVWRSFGPTEGRPGARHQHRALYDAGNDRMLVLGGEVDVTMTCSRGTFGGTAYRNQTFAYSFSSDTWTNLGGVADGIHALFQPLFEPRRGEVIQLGGVRVHIYCSHGVPAANIFYYPNAWKFRGVDAPANWERFTIQGENWIRHGSGAVYDPVHERFLTIGGSYDGGRSGPRQAALDVGEDGLAWSPFTVANSGPSIGSDDDVVYDPVTGRIFVYSPFSQSASDGDGQLWVLELDGPPPVLAEPSIDEADYHAVRLRWRLAPGVDPDVRVQRRRAGGEWRLAGNARAEEGVVHVVDDGLAAGEDVAYRLVVTLRGTTLVAGEQVVRTPIPAATRLAAVHPNPARHAFNLVVELAEAGNVAMEVFDVSGRRVHSETAAALPPGRHTLTLEPEPPLASGHYFIVARTGDRRFPARVTIVR